MGFLGPLSWLAFRGVAPGTWRLLIPTVTLVTVHCPMAELDLLCPDTP
jgi:hypothetical protein